MLLLEFAWVVIVVVVGGLAIFFTAPLWSEFLGIGLQLARRIASNAINTIVAAVSDKKDK